MHFSKTPVNFNSKRDKCQAVKCFAELQQIALSVTVVTTLNPFFCDCRRSICRVEFYSETADVLSDP